jgi:hypothetical protein
MFSRKREPTLLDEAIERALRDLNNHAVGSPEYVKTVDMLYWLNEMKEDPSPRVSKDTMLIVGGNLLGILMIINHEHLNPIVSKAMSLLLKPRG